MGEFPSDTVVNYSQSSTCAPSQPELEYTLLLRIGSAILASLLTLLILTGLAAAQIPVPIGGVQQESAVVAGQAPAPAPAMSSAGATTVGPGDLVEFSVVGVTDLTSKSRVTDEGMLGIPLVGPVKVGGILVAFQASVHPGGELEQS